MKLQHLSRPNCHYFSRNLINKAMHAAAAAAAQTVLSLGNSVCDPEIVRDTP